MKQKSILFLLGCACCILSSCLSPKERAFNHFYELYEDVSANSNYYTSEDWEYFIKDYVETDSILSTYELTPEEQKEVNELRGKCSVYIFKEAAKEVGTELLNLFGGFGDYLNGVSEELDKILK